jgi:hypothetical protein
MSEKSQLEHYFFWLHKMIQFFFVFHIKDIFSTNFLFLPFATQYSERYDV